MTIQSCVCADIKMAIFSLHTCLPPLPPPFFFNSTHWTTIQSILNRHSSLFFFFFGLLALSTHRSSKQTSNTWENTQEALWMNKNKEKWEGRGPSEPWTFCWVLERPVVNTLKKRSWLTTACAVDGCRKTWVQWDIGHGDHSFLWLFFHWLS